MNSTEEQLRDQLKTAEEVSERWKRLFDAQQKRLEEGIKVLEPFLAIAKAYAHLPEQTIIVSRATRVSINDWKTVNLEVRHTNALLAWANEEAGK